MPESVRKADKVLIQSEALGEWTEIGYIDNPFDAIDVPVDPVAPVIRFDKVQKTVRHEVQLLDYDLRAIERLFYGFDIFTLRQTVAAWIWQYGSRGYHPAFPGLPVRKPRNGDA